MFWSGHSWLGKAEFLDFSNGDKKKANKMWEGAKPVETEENFMELRQVDQGQGNMDTPPMGK